MLGVTKFSVEICDGAQSTAHSSIYYYWIYFNIVDLCGILPYKRMYPHKCGIKINIVGAQWLSGRVLDSRPKGLGFEPHRRHCVVVLEQDTFILA